MLWGEMADMGTEPGGKQGDSGASYSARKWDSAKKQDKTKRSQIHIMI